MSSLGIALNKGIPKNRSFWSLGHFRAFLFYVAIVAVLFGGHAGYGFVVKSGNTVVLDLHGHTITKDNPHGNYSDFVGNVTVEADDSMNVDKDDDTGQEDAE